MSTNPEPLVDLVTLEKVHRLLADATVDACTEHSSGGHRSSTHGDEPPALARVGGRAALPQRR